MEVPEGAFKQWGYDLAKNEFGATDYQGEPSPE